MKNILQKMQYFEIVMKTVRVYDLMPCKDPNISVFVSKNFCT